MADRKIKIIRLIEPEICLECRFSRMADVEEADGSVKRMIYCRRLDCDNWDSSSSETVRSITFQDP
jgi:hypothetical protein